jgi:hypothetical protein
VTIWVGAAVAFVAGTFFGLLLAGLLAAARAGNGPPAPAGGVVSGPEDLERLGLAVLGVIPDVGGETVGGPPASRQRGSARYSRGDG